MSTANNVPQILERKDVIILSGDIECHCGRLKDKVHCPSCGKAKMYGMSESVIAPTPDGNVIKGCHVYRCQGCGLKFNDVDWYFKCSAPIKIDWATTKAKAIEDMRAKKLKEWIDRVKLGHHFDYNDKQKCKSETGMNLGEIQELMKAALRHRPLTERTLQEKIAYAEDAIDNLSAYLKDHPDDEEAKEQLQKEQGLLTSLRGE